MSRTTTEILEEMLVDLKELTGVELTPNDLHRDEVVSLYPIAGALSAIESKIDMVNDNFHPGTADEDGLEKHLDSHQLPKRRLPQKSQGRISLTGTDLTTVPRDTLVRRKLNGHIFISIQDGIIASGSVTNTFESLQSGQEFNIDSIGEEFELVNAIPGVDASCLSTTPFLNGRDLETPGEMLQRIQDKIRRTDTGGNLPAYERFAKEASPLVVTATAIKHPRGVSTVDTVITSGTTDIDKAVDEDQPVLRIPSPELIAVVQQYVDIKKPTTDDHETVSPSVEEFDTNIILAVHDESLRPRVEAEITKIWKKFVYKVKPQQRIYPTDLEKLIDAKLGHLIKFRRVEDFTEDHYYDAPPSSVLNPNTLTMSLP